MTTIARPVLSVAMREGSRAAHTAAENSSFMAELTAGRVNARGYRDYLRSFRAVYARLEMLSRQLADDPAVAAVHDPMLERLPALEADLEFWARRAEVESSTPGDSPPAGAIVESPATTAYLERLATTPDWPPLLLAHHYTRYLGDLSGGQAVGRILDREFDLAGQGVAFYVFEAIPKPKRYKDAYRARLDALDLTELEQQRVVDEVSVAFALNQAIFTELGRRLPEYRLAG